MLIKNMAKSISKYVEQIFPIECKGRNRAGIDVFDSPIKINLRIYKTPDSSIISSDVSECPYNSGSHGHRCRAAVPKNTDKTNEGARCPYSFDIPYALDSLNNQPSNAEPKDLPLFGAGYALLLSQLKAFGELSPREMVKQFNIKSKARTK